jgi:serine/threonine-protein kinase RsbW
MAIQVEKESQPLMDQRRPCHILIPSDPSEARRVQEEIETTLKAHQFCENDIFGIRLALEEALINAIKHGNRMERGKQVRITYQVHADQFTVHIEDEGGGFNPNALPDPTAEENLERPCGRGVMLMRHFMSEVSFNDSGNSVTMCKHRNGRA